MSEYGLKDSPHMKLALACGFTHFLVSARHARAIGFKFGEPIRPVHAGLSTFILNIES